jgi:glycosyltransferase involved in cell wall biosynthesis
MTYYDRQFQLDKTLKSISESKLRNFEVIIVDDGSPVSVDVKSQNFPVTILTRTASKWKCSSAAYNTGIYYAMLQKPDVIIIQNAECYHVGDVIKRASEIKGNEYLTFGCYSIDRETTFRKLESDMLILNNVGASSDGQNAWYNHPRYRPVYYHFCSVISANNMKLLNGFEERLMEGIGFEDDNFLSRVRMLNLDVKIIENPLVVHQWHYSQTCENKAELVEKNRSIHKEILKERNYKATNSLKL